MLLWQNLISNYTLATFVTVYIFLNLKCKVVQMRESVIMEIRWTPKLEDLSLNNIHDTLCTETWASHWALVFSSVSGDSHNSYFPRFEMRRCLRNERVNSRALHKYWWLLLHMLVSPRVKHSVLNIHCTQYLLVD